MNFTFKQIEKEELNLVLELFKESAEKIDKKNVDHWQYWKNPPKEKINWVVEGIYQKEFFFIYDSMQQNIGMVRIMNEDLLYWGKQIEKAKYIHSFVIREEFNGKGFGQKIIESIEFLATKENCKYLRLDADSKNPKLCNYYENLGFQKVGEKKLPLSIYNLYEKELKK
ncbi:GNAT family N-acetyltransferase [Aureivirga sp. CE67]|uniref:GNAT family N-acetyltransferase n=1 Tax=Aureivirga sp. CE67 TaxID=1788983 RepID=UPI0018CAF2D7|nr:GNAT family N-acetyltransferase [Aureivirga sp. CE67]